MGIKLFSNLKKSEYARNSTILMGGTVISMVLNIVSVAWLGKYYKDEFWGIYEYFCTAYSVFLNLATGRYELSIMLPKEDNDGFMMTILSASLSVAFSAIMLIVLVMFWMISGISLDWVIYLPLVLLVLGIYYSANYWLNRKKCYIKLAVNRVIQGVLFVFFNLLYAFILPDKRYGLIYGYITAQVIVMLMFIVYMVRDYKKYNIKISLIRIKELAIQYKDFPRISSISGLINNISTRLPVMLLGMFSNSAVVGQYSMMNRILGAPITAISEAIRDVFRQRASKEYAKTAQCEDIYNSTFKTLAITALIPFLLIIIGVKPVLNGIFGDLWNMAGNFVMLMCPFYYIKFIVSPLSFMTYIANKQRFDMKWQLLLCGFSAISFFAGSYLTHNVYFMLLFYGIALSIMYGISFFYTKKLAKGLI